MQIIYSFDPIVDNNSSMLILGSMPGGESLRKEQYYGYERNSFWRIVFKLMDEPFCKSYKQKKQFLLRNGIALWDVVKSCERQGSLDANIKRAIVNDFPSFFNEHPKINRVFFNGRTAYDIFKKHVGFTDDRTYTYLYSTSPAHAVPFSVKLDNWRQIVQPQE